MIIRKYQCVQCNYHFDTDISGMVICTQCGSVYVKWLNYEQLKKKGVFDGSK